MVHDIFRWYLNGVSALGIIKRMTAYVNIITSHCLYGLKRGSLFRLTPCISFRIWLLYRVFCASFPCGYVTALNTRIYPQN